MNPEIRKLGPEGAAEAVAWAESEGWQPGLTDAGPFYAADPAGFFGSCLDGSTIATLSVVRAGDRVAFVGLYIVAPAHRGRGHGRRLWDQALAEFDGYTLGLDAVPEQVETYASDGFVAAYGNARYSIQAGDLPAPDPRPGILGADEVSFDRLVDFDAAHFFGPRPDFLQGWIDGEGRRAVVVADQGAVGGFAARRQTSTGHRIGPVFAESADLARQLILELAGEISGPVAVDVPQPNAEAVDLLTDLGLKKSFETTRMYRGEPPSLPLERIFGITTLELG